MEITLVGIGLLIGFALSWIMGLSGGDVFIWIFCLYFGLQVGQLIFSERLEYAAIDNNALEALTPVSYTHLTLPTIAVV